MCLAATRRLRELSYEAFLYGHIAGAIVWIVGCYYHVWLLDPEYSYLKVSSISFFKSRATLLYTVSTALERSAGVAEIRCRRRTSKLTPLISL